MSAVLLRAADTVICDHIGVAVVAVAEHVPAVVHEAIAAIYVAPRFWGVPHKPPPAPRPRAPRGGRFNVDRAGASTAHDPAGEDAGPVPMKAARPTRGTPPRGTGGRPPH